MSNKKIFVGVGKGKFDKPDQQKQVDSISKNIAILTGQTRNKDDRAVLHRDLKQLGLTSANITSIVNGSAIGGGGGNGGGVVDPATELPTKPTNVTANGAFTTIMIQWDFPSYAGHKHAEIWRNTVNQLGDMLDPRSDGEAVLVATTPDAVYVDTVNFNTGYYYWVRFVNIDDPAAFGPVHAASGVFAQTQQDITQAITDVEDYIDGEVATLDQGFNEALGLANTAIGIADGKAQDALDDISVRINGVLVGLGTDITNIQNDYPTLAYLNTTYSTTAEANQAATDITTSAISALNIGQYSTISFIETNYYTQTDTTNTINGLIDTFYNTTITPNFKTSAQISLDHYTKTDANDAIAGQINTFQSTVLTPNYKTAAQTNLDHYTKADANSAISSEVNTLKSQIFDVNGTTVNSAFINQVRISSTDLNNAISTGVDNYSVSYGGSTYSIAQVTQASVDINNDYTLQWGVKSTVGQLNFGIGFLNNSGVTTFAASVNNFAIYNPSNNALELAFAVVDGQIVAKKALIGSAQIRELLIQEQSVFEGNVLVNTRLTAAKIYGAEIIAGRLEVRGGTHVLTIEPTGTYAMWYGSSQSFPVGGDFRNDSSAKFALRQDGTVITRGMKMYNNLGGLVIDAGGGINGVYINNLSVDTLKISDRAITAPVSAFTSAATGNSLLQSVSITTTGGSVEVFGHGYIGIVASGGGSSFVYYNLYRGATLLATFTLRAQSDRSVYSTTMAMYVDEPPIGNHTYTLTRSGYSANVSARYLAVREFKK